MYVYATARSVSCCAYKLSFFTRSYDSSNLSNSPIKTIFFSLEDYETYLDSRKSSLSFSWPPISSYTYLFGIVRDVGWNSRHNKCVRAWKRITRETYKICRGVFLSRFLRLRENLLDCGESTNNASPARD